MSFTTSQNYMLMKTLEASLAQYHTANNGQTEELCELLAVWHYAHEKTHKKRGTFMARLFSAYERKGVTDYLKIRAHLVHALDPRKSPAEAARSLLEVKTTR